MSRRVRISAVAIARNEEADMPGFLANFSSWVDEIVVVDDGSTDRTREICQQAGDPVVLVDSPRVDGEHFSHQRNKGIEAATGEWLLHLDVDERASPELVKEIREVVRSDRFDAYCYRRRNFFLHREMKGGGWQTWNKPQLARKGHHRFINDVHEECVVDGGDSRIGQLQGFMWHLNDATYRERMRKSDQYCQYQAKSMADYGLRVRAWHLVVLPTKEFLKKYFLRHGYRDGTPGLLFALHAATATFRACALLWDEQNPKSRESLEAALKESAEE